MSVEFEGNKACIAPEGVFIIGTYDEKGCSQCDECRLGSSIGLW